MKTLILNTALLATTFAFTNSQNPIVLQEDDAEMESFTDDKFDIQMGSDDYDDSFNTQFILPESQRQRPDTEQIDQPKEIQKYFNKMKRDMKKADKLNEKALKRFSKDGMKKVTKRWKRILRSISDGLSTMSRVISVAVENPLVQEGVSLILNLAESKGNDYTKVVAKRVNKEIHDVDNLKMARFVRKVMDKDGWENRRLQSQDRYRELRSKLTKPASIAGNMLGDLLYKNELLQEGQNLMVKHIKGVDSSTLRPNCVAFLVSFLSYETK